VLHIPIVVEGEMHFVPIGRSRTRHSGCFNCKGREVAILPVHRLHLVAGNKMADFLRDSGDIFGRVDGGIVLCIWKVRCSNLGWNNNYPDRPPMVFLSLGQATTSFVAAVRSRLFAASLCRIG
jgi:hypothetical protein